MRKIALLLLVLLCAAPAMADCPPPPAWCSGSYAYDGMGNISQIGADMYVYDTVGRLVSASADYQRTGVLSRQDYTYDAYGNRQTATRRPGSVGCDVTCELNHSIDAATNHLQENVRYDEAGNVEYIQDTVNGSTYVATYEYDSLGMITHGKAGADDRQFVYTADDERIAIRQGVSWTWTVRGASNQVLREFTSVESNGLPTMNFQWLKDYVYRDGALLETKTAGATTGLNFHLDHLGTPRMVTNDAKDVAGVHSYYAFGAELTLSPKETGPELLKFTGHERDQLAANPHTLDDMHARYYSANLGRFLSVDPIRGDPRAPQSWNRYSYVRNNPVRFTDPDGRNLLEGDAAGNALWNYFWQDFYNRASGFANAFASDMLLGRFRVDLNNQAYREAQVFGDATATAVGLVEVGDAIVGEAGGIFLDLSVVGAPAGATLNVGAAALGLHGASTTLTGGAHLMSAMNSRSGGGSLRQLSKGEVKALERKGIDVHDLKGGKGASKFDLYKDRNGNIYVVRKGGGGVPEPTGYNIRNFVK